MTSTHVAIAIRRVLSNQGPYTSTTVVVRQADHAEYDEHHYRSEGRNKDVTPWPEKMFHHIEPAGDAAPFSSVMLLSPLTTHTHHRTSRFFL